MTLLIDNETFKRVISMKDCIEILEASYTEEGQGRAANRTGESGYSGLAHKDETASIWKKYIRYSDPRATDESWTYFQKAFVPNLRPDPIGIKNVRDFSVVPGNPKTALIPPEQYVYWDSVEELERQKFFSELALKYGLTMPLR